MNFSFLFVIVSLISLSSINAIEIDYCVADIKLPYGASGYACMDPKSITVNDFSYSGLRTPASTSNIFKFGGTVATVKEFPALNGLDISMARADLEVGGVAPMHTHRATELVILIEGTITIGFVDTNNKAFYKNLEKGDMFVVPPTLQHFLVNVGNTKAIAYAAYDSPNPGTQSISLSLFKSDLPSPIIQKTTLLDLEQITKLKKGFGGTN